MAQRIAIALLVFLAAASCGGGPVDPSQNINTSFSGTVQPLGVGEPQTHFTVSSLGEFTVTLTSLTPGNVFVGIGWGQWTGSSCGLIAGQTNVVSNANIGRGVLAGQIFIKGEYCVVVFDAANFGAPPLTVAQNYAGQVSHP
jgi:hypothetical protein